MQVLIKYYTVFSDQLHNYYIAFECQMIVSIDGRRSKSHGLENNMFPGLDELSAEHY